MGAAHREPFDTKEKNDYGQVLTLAGNGEQRLAFPGGHIRDIGLRINEKTEVFKWTEQ